MNVHLVPLCTVQELGCCRAGNQGWIVFEGGENTPTPGSTPGERVWTLKAHSKASTPLRRTDNRFPLHDPNLSRQIDLFVILHDLRSSIVDHAAGWDPSHLPVMIFFYLNDLL